MRNRIIYGIIKTYKGIFSKTHIGNVQILIIEMEKKFWVLNVLGTMEDGKHATQLILSAPSQYIHVFLDDFEENQNFILIEELLCDIPKESLDEFNIILKQKGKYLLSNYTITYSDEYSSGDIKVYMIKGSFNPIMPDSFNNKAQLNMVALKQRTMAKPLINKFMASIKK